MSRLDDHVAAVQNRMALGLFTIALGWAAVGFAGVVLLAVLFDRIFMLSLTRPVLWMYGGLAAVVVGSLVYALRNRPSPRDAAIPIDQKLGLKEKISTALYIRPDSDPFARAAVYDAEQTAQQVVVNLGQHFPIAFPKPTFIAIGLLLLSWIAYRAIDPMSLFNREEVAAKKAEEEKKSEEAKSNIQKAIARIDEMPKVPGTEEAFQLAKAELQAMLVQPTIDPNKANRTSLKALQDLGDALKEQAKNNARYAQAQNEMKMFKSMQKPVEGQGPVTDAHRAIVDGNFNEAVEELTKAIENFEKMDKEQQQKAAEQMSQLAQQLQQQGNNTPAQQQKMQQQMQQMGMNQQQQQQAQQLMQQAAQGDKQAQQQMQQLMQQVQQQMQQAGMNQQQQQQAQQMMQQMQAQQNAQQQAQQMAQAAQQMAQAMKQAAQQAQGQQGQQPGQQQNPQQGMAQAMNAMQQQLQNMQAAAQDAQQIAAAQAAAQAAQAAAQQAMNGNGQGQGGQGQQAGMWNPGNNQGQNNPNQPFNGQAGFAGPNQGGIGAGDRTYKQQAPFAVKEEIDPSQDDPNGRILASNFIKDLNPDRGNSTQTLKEVAERALNEQTDEIDQERISRQAASAVREYFKSIPDAQGQGQ